MQLLPLGGCVRHTTVYVGLSAETEPLITHNLKLYSYLDLGQTFLICPIQSLSLQQILRHFSDCFFFSSESFLNLNCFSFSRFSQTVTTTLRDISLTRKKVFSNA